MCSAVGVWVEGWGNTDRTDGVCCFYVSPSLLWEMGVYFSPPPPPPSKIAVLTTYCLLLTVNLLLLDSENKGFYEPINESHLRPEWAILSVGEICASSGNLTPITCLK